MTQAMLIDKATGEHIKFGPNNNVVGRLEDAIEFVESLSDSGTLPSKDRTIIVKLDTYVINDFKLYDTVQVAASEEQLQNIGIHNIKNGYLGTFLRKLKKRSEVRFNINDDYQDAIIPNKYLKQPD